MAKQKFTLIDTDKTKKTEKAVAEVKEVKKQGSVLFLSNGDFLKIFSSTRSAFKKVLPDGSEQVIVKDAKRLLFRQRMAETSDKVTIKAALKDKSFGKTYFYHPISLNENTLLPKGMTLDRAREVVKSFVSEAKGFLAEKKQMIENAKSFDKNAHPEKGMDVVRDGISEVGEW